MATSKLTWSQETTEQTILRLAAQRDGLEAEVNLLKDELEAAMAAFADLSSDSAAYERGRLDVLRTWAHRHAWFRKRLAVFLTQARDQRGDTRIRTLFELAAPPSPGEILPPTGEGD